MEKHIKEQRLVHLKGTLDGAVDQNDHKTWNAIAWFLFIYTLLNMLEYCICALALMYENYSCTVSNFGFFNLLMNLFIQAL